MPKGCNVNCVKWQNYADIPLKHKAKQKYTNT